MLYSTNIIQLPIKIKCSQLELSEARMCALRTSAASSTITTLGFIA